MCLWPTDAAVTFVLEVWMVSPRVVVGVVVHVSSSAVAVVTRLLVCSDGGGGGGGATVPGLVMTFV